MSDSRLTTIQVLTKNQPNTVGVSGLDANKMHTENLSNGGSLLFLLTKTETDQQYKSQDFFYKVIYISPEKNSHEFDPEFIIRPCPDNNNNKPTVYANQTSIYIKSDQLLFCFNLKNQLSISYNTYGDLKHLADGSKIGLIEMTNPNKENQSTNPLDPSSPLEMLMLEITTNNRKRTKLFHLTPSLEMRIFEDEMPRDEDLKPKYMTIHPNGRFIFTRQVQRVHSTEFDKYSPYHDKYLCFDLAKPSPADATKTEIITRQALSFTTELGYVKNITSTQDGKYVFYVNGFYDGDEEQNWLRIIEIDKSHKKIQHIAPKIDLGKFHRNPGLVLTSDDRVCIVHSQDKVLFIDVSIKNTPHIYSSITHPKNFRSATIITLLPDEKHLVVGTNAYSARHFDCGFRSNFSIYPAPPLVNRRHQSYRSISLTSNDLLGHELYAKDEKHITTEGQNNNGAPIQLPSVRHLFSHSDLEGGYIRCILVTPDSKWMVIQKTPCSKSNHYNEGINFTLWDISNLSKPKSIRCQFSDIKSCFDTMTDDWKFIQWHNSKITHIHEIDLSYKKYTERANDTLVNVAKMPRELIKLTMDYAGFTLFKPSTKNGDPITTNDSKQMTKSSPNSKTTG